VISASKSAPDEELSRAVKRLFYFWRFFYMWFVVELQEHFDEVGRDHKGIYFRALL
jgi:hypothetical protein